MYFLELLYGPPWPIIILSEAFRIYLFIEHSVVHVLVSFFFSLYVCLKM